MVAGLNNLDLLLIFIIVIGILVGFMRGVGPQLISFVSVFGSLLITLWLYRTFSSRILQDVGMSKVGGDTAAFIILLMVFFHSIRLLVKSFSTPPEEKKKKKKPKGYVGPMENIQFKTTSVQKYIVGPFMAVGGLLMGFLLTVLWAAIILAMFQFLFQDAVFAAGVPGAGLGRELKTSSLIPYFNNLLWYLFYLLDFVDPPDSLGQDPHILKFIIDRLIYESLSG